MVQAYWISFPVFWGENQRLLLLLLFRSLRYQRMGSDVVVWVMRNCTVLIHPLSNGFRSSDVADEDRGDGALWGHSRQSHRRPPH